MGCCTSSPHSRRKYRDPADLDEVVVPLREFGNYRNGTTNLIPDDIDGLPSTHNYKHLASDPDTLLYEAEIDQGHAFRCCQPWIAVVCLPYFWVWAAARGLGQVLAGCTCDEVVCWLRKEYSTRNFFRVYPNRIEFNVPNMRIPFGFLGCGSWNADNIITNPFDRGAFGFRRVKSGVCSLLLCIYPVFGETLARQRCQCNGSLWSGGCSSWWCDEWCCDMMCCTYRYKGLADADETAFAAGTLQAYFEGRKITREEMNKCLDHYHDNISERTDPEGRKRDVCCEPFYIPLCSCLCCYEYVCHPHRNIPFDEEDPLCTPELVEVYDKYKELRDKQVENYKQFTGPVRKSTCCRALGCRRLFGRRGFFFCTEGCNDPDSSCCSKKAGDPAPPFRYKDIDDINDASVVLRAVLGDPPLNVTYRGWQWDEVSNEFVLPPCKETNESLTNRSANIKSFRELRS
ncbi:hypothetical protein QTG54_014191 [Skeletonema marinoi]|uniref:Uncharacterized protein n=1 Tax=Skeletonema marinoi TaxID=267567 RepID=A0AAD8XX33_9STRA|nr:hypothetical protein QTG54_014191 [Skeletonema marinoi]